MPVGITTHVLDVARGRPAAGVPVALEVFSGGEWKELACAETDGDGRAKQLLPPDHVLTLGTYRLTFDLASWFSTQEIEAFYPSATIVFLVRNAGQHYHVPLLLSPYGYSTYRGT
ncbi:MAG TPA: hydroxyisourate hydrolase [Thermoanaerobaculia bacterium]|nr:hydroxyisourate hydrolase [Thermoanaerobaculia bacterium]